MAKNVQMKVRNATNTDWDDLNPRTKASLVETNEATTVESEITTIKNDVQTGKNSVASSLTTMNQPSSGTDSFSTLATKITNISNDADATITEVISSKTFYQGGQKRTGTMTNRGAVSHSLAVNGTYTVPAGYHNGSGSVNQNISTKTAETYTPGTTNQTISAGQYLTGNQTISGSANLTAANIKNGINIFNVVGNFAGYGIKSRQTGTTQLASEEASPKSVTISTVSLSNSIIVANSTTGTSPIGGKGIRTTFANSTTLSFYRPSSHLNYGASYIIDWQVIEFYPEVASVQRGTYTRTTAAAHSITTSSHPQEKSIVFLTFAGSANSTRYLQEANPRVTANTTISLFSPQQASETIYISWERLDFI